MRLLTVGFELCSAGSRGVTTIKMSDQSVLLNKCLQTAYLGTAIYDKRSLQMLPMGCIRAASSDRCYLRQRSKTDNFHHLRAAFFITRFYDRTTKSTPQRWQCTRKARAKSFRDHARWSSRWEPAAVGAGILDRDGASRANDDGYVEGVKEALAL
jgi:hypothetical protein